MKIYRNIIVLVVILLQNSYVQTSWLLVGINNNCDLTLVKAARNNDVEIPSISQILTQAVNQHAIMLSPELLFGSAGGCKIIAQNKQAVPFSFVFYGDPVHRVANGRALFADLDSRNGAATLKSAMMARVFMVRNDGSMKLVGYTGYEVNNQKIIMLLQGSNQEYQVVLKAVV